MDLELTRKPVLAGIAILGMSLLPLAGAQAEEPMQGMDGS